MVDWVGFIEAANASEPDDYRWAEGVLRIAERLLSSVGDLCYVGMMSIAHGPSCENVRATFVTSRTIDSKSFPMIAHDYEALLDAIGVEGTRALWYPPAIVAKQTEWVRLHCGGEKS